MCGFGFVTMARHANAEKAVKESVGMKINGREVAVDFAVNKTHWDNVKVDLEKKVTELDTSETAGEDSTSDVDMAEGIKDDT